MKGKTILTGVIVGIGVIFLLLIVLFSKQNSLFRADLIDSPCGGNILATDPISWPEGHGQDISCTWAPEHDLVVSLNWPSDHNASASATWPDNGHAENTSNDWPLSHEYASSATWPSSHSV